MDENEIVEQAYVSLTGDLCPTFFGYGPFVSYLLTGLYAAARGLLKVLAGWSDSDFFYRAIFEPTPFYAAGRVLHALADVAAVAVAARVAMRHAGLAAGWAVLALGAAPLLSLNTDFPIRRDLARNRAPYPIKLGSRFNYCLSRAISERHGRIVAPEFSTLRTRREPPTTDAV